MLTRVENLWQEESRRIPRRYCSEWSSVERPEATWNRLKPGKKTIANLLCGVNLHRGFESPPLRQIIDLRTIRRIVGQSTQRNTDALQWSQDTLRTRCDGTLGLRSVKDTPGSTRSIIATPARHRPVILRSSTRIPAS